MAPSGGQKQHEESLLHPSGGHNRRFRVVFGPLRVPLYIYLPSGSAADAWGCCCSAVDSPALRLTAPPSERERGAPHAPDAPGARRSPLHDVHDLERGRCLTTVGGGRKLKRPSPRHARPPFFPLPQNLNFAARCVAVRWATRQRAALAATAKTRAGRRRIEFGARCSPRNETRTTNRKHRYTERVQDRMPHGQS